MISFALSGLLALTTITGGSLRFTPGCVLIAAPRLIEYLDLKATYDKVTPSRAVA